MAGLASAVTAASAYSRAPLPSTVDHDNRCDRPVVDHQPGPHHGGLRRCRRHHLDRPLPGNDIAGHGQRPGRRRGLRPRHVRWHTPGSQPASPPRPWSLTQPPLRPVPQTGAGSGHGQRKTRTSPALHQPARQPRHPHLRSRHPACIAFLSSARRRSRKGDQVSPWGSCLTVSRASWLCGSRPGSTGSDRGYCRNWQGWGDEHRVTHLVQRADRAPRAGTPGRRTSGVDSITPCRAARRPSPDRPSSRPRRRPRPSAPPSRCCRFAANPSLRWPIPE